MTTKTPKNPKYPHITRTRLSADQLAQAQADAQTCGKSLAAYIRDRITGKRIKARTDDAMLRELRRIGGLIKHVHAPAEIASALDRLAERIES